MVGMEERVMLVWRDGWVDKDSGSEGEIIGWESERVEFPSSDKLK